GSGGACLRSSPPKKRKAGGGNTSPRLRINQRVLTVHSNSWLPPLRRSVGLRRIPFGRRTARQRRFRPDFVVTEHPHEDLLVDRLPRVVEHRRNSLYVAEFRAFPRNDHQRLGRFLIAQDRHTKRLSSGDGNQLTVLLLLCLRFFSLSLCSFRLSLHCFRLILVLVSLGRRSIVLLRKNSRGRQDKDRKQRPVNEQRVSLHGFSFWLPRLRRSAIHLVTSASSGTIRLYAS